MAKMPECRIVPSYVGDMTSGDSGWIEVDSIVVGLDRTVYVRPKGQLFRRMSTSWPIRIWVDECCKRHADGSRTRASYKWDKKKVCPGQVLRVHHATGFKCPCECSCKCSCN